MNRRGAITVGEKWGRLTVESSFMGLVRGKHKQVALCICACGTRVEVLFSNRKQTRSCGCLFAESVRKARGASGLNTLLNVYRHNAKKRGLTFDLNSEDFQRITGSDCHYCGSAPSLTIVPSSGTYTEAGRENSRYTYNGVDRVDNSIGYVLSNCVPCCKRCNAWKRDLTLAEFCAHVRAIAARL